MISQVLSHMEGVGIFATLPLLMFMLMFVVVVFWALRLDKSKVNQWAKIPLSQDSLLPRENGKSDSSKSDQLAQGDR